ncbi:MAG TPA: hypothetical protein VME69_12985, partial [Methylocella sp.]|nr:hypothetical protein [Methylocella sp.]
AEPSTIAEEIALFDHFWGSRFRLSVRFTSNFPTRRRAAYPREEFRLLSMLNRAEVTRALGAIPCASERTSVEADLHRLLDLVVRDATEWAAGKARWDETRENPRALYVFGHCDGTALYLHEDGATDGSLSVADFVTDWQDGSGPPTVVFFNGCRSAAGSGYLSFLQNSWQSGFRGCIATEARIPNAFALKYGVRFMERVCFGGASVGEVFDDLRGSPSLFPLSLLYGCYADTEFRVEPALANA